VSKHYFTADWHLYHHNILKHSNRPFKDVFEMNDKILENIQAVVKPEDWLYFLGDLAFTHGRPDVELVKDWLDEIPTQNMVWILGNHDKYYRDYQNWFKKVCEVHRTKIDGQEIFLSHYAHMVWPSSHHGTWSLCGHSHGSLKEILPDYPTGKQIDVGVDVHNFKPLSFDEIKQIMDKKSIQEIDHH
jgi:calcineurin-like phosphoesterase family protein